MWRGVARVLALVMAIGMLSACRPRPLMYVYQPVAGQYWSRLDTLRFDLPHQADSTLRQVSVGIRCSNHLAYQDLWLVVEQRTETVRRDTVHFILTDASGEWLESDGILHDVERPVTTVALTAPTPRLLIYHIMEPFAVRGISDVGVRVE